MTTMVTEDLAQRIATARSLKAAKIARVLRAAGCDAATVVRLDDKARRLAETTAGLQRKASDDTWRVVVEMLAESARARALCTTCGIGDPQGIPGPRKTDGHSGPCSK